MQQDLPENNLARNVAPQKIELTLTYSHNDQYYWMKYKWRCLSSKSIQNRTKSSLRHSNNVMKTIEILTNQGDCPYLPNYMNKTRKEKKKSQFSF